MARNNFTEAFDNLLHGLVLEGVIFIAKSLCIKYVVFEERAGGVEPGDREVPTAIRRERIGTSGGCPQGARQGGRASNPFFREEKTGLRNTTGSLQEYFKTFTEILIKRTK